MAYQVDLRDIEFQIFEWLDLEPLLAHPRYEDWDREGLEMVLGEAFQISRDLLAPSNSEGDRAGAEWEKGEVKVPPSFLPAYQALAEGGWIGCVNNPELGGTGLPQVMGTAATELFSGANLALSLVVMLTRGVGELIENHGSGELQEIFCEKLYSGEWTGTMCLTEAQAGSDVGASATKAFPIDNGRYLLSGEKVFITYGDHDLTDNIVHAVLARLPEAPSGTRGLSLFIVPGRRIHEDGSLGDSNGVACTGIEHKMGLHGSPTCTLLFGGDGESEGYLIGERNAGIRLMFELMNTARIEVGLEGVAVAGAALQAALGFANERQQGRRWDQLADKDAASVPIVEHPDVRRMLTHSSSYVQAMRALLLRTTYYSDRAKIAEGEDAERYRSLLALLTPLCKAWASDWGFRVTEWCLQVYGGYGYLSEYPAEQYLRDVKITSIYEGTNGIQALDLVLRKLSSKGGKPLAELLGAADATVSAAEKDEVLCAASQRLAEALSAFRAALETLLDPANARWVPMIEAVPILDMLGHVLSGGFLIEQAILARRRQAEILAAKGIDRTDLEAYQDLLSNDPDLAFYHNKILIADHFSHRALPMVQALGQGIGKASEAPMQMVF